MAEEQNNTGDIGIYARHPLRTMGAAFLAGTVFGANMIASKKASKRHGWQRFLD